MEGFDKNRSQVSADSLAKFLQNDLVEDITSVPGIGKAAKTKLATSKVLTSYQLIGVFLSLREPGMTSDQHCDAMWYWLKATGIDSYRAGIVHSLAEKVSLMIPGICTY